MKLALLLKIFNKYFKEVTRFKKHKFTVKIINVSQNIKNSYASLRAVDLCHNNYYFKKYINRYKDN